jgi:hypothetical protein
LIVANILIRAGFDLTLEDEADPTSKHCEFAAVSKGTGKRYWVEARMRSVAGLLGKTARDGTSDPDPISRLVPHLNGAFRKPAADERLIFVDLNTEPTTGGKPPWIELAAARLERYEKRELAQGAHAYVFVTNFAFHRDLKGQATMAAFPMTLGIDDFARPGMRRPSDAYRLKQKHIDAHHIGQTLAKYTRFPATFDGSLPSETIDSTQPRVIAGNTYCFGDLSNGGIVGTVTSASVSEGSSEAFITIIDQNGVRQILKETMTPRQLADYRAHKESYFGRFQPVGGRIDSPFELFEWFIECYKGLSREQLLKNLAHAPHIAALQSMNDQDLLYEYCDMLVAMALRLKK